MDPLIITPVAEATKAVAETSGKAIDATTDFAKIFKGPVAELIGCVEDKFKYIRWERRQALMAKSEAYMQAKGLSVPTRELPLPFSVPLLTACVMEEDDDLQEIWARLLVNAGDASTEMELRTAYIEIFRGMSAFDVKNLAALVEATLNLPAGTPRTLGVMKVLHPELMGPGVAPPLPAALEASMANLARLGCAMPSSGLNGSVLFSGMAVTELGIAFYRACS
jgi:hypothetical protein